jgi:diguanylate cyclase (GGDEF)-like protein
MVAAIAGYGIAVALPRRMRLVGRNDTSLAVALIVGTVVLFHQPLGFLLETAAEIQRQYHVDLIQALLVLGGVFGLHQFRKRQEAKAEALASAAEAQQARLRSEELTRLVALSRALASATDFRGLERAIARYLPKFTHERTTWFLVCQGGCWDVLFRDGDHRRPVEETEAIADRALAADGAAGSPGASVQVDDTVCVPLMVGGTPVGLVQVLDSPPLSAEERRALEAASGLAAIAVCNVQTFIETKENSLRDSLTGCFNRAYAVETIDAEMRRARRKSQPLSVLMFDVDGFKHVNDTYGHLTGDHLLSLVGKTLRDVLRTTDIKCRYGGDEFLIVLPDTPAAGARQVAESIRRELSNVVLAAADARVSVTVSLGIATSSADDRDAPALIARADRALYRAKQAGRNRACADVDPAASPLRLVSVAT